MRIAFFGTPAFALASLDALLASAHTVVAVVTQPDRRRGRGQVVTASAVKQRALEAGMPVLQPERLTADPWAPRLTPFVPDLGVVVAYGQILPDWVLQWPRRGLINVHASLLPRYRGAAPVHRAILNGEVETGVSIMRVVRALDAGPVLATVRLPISAEIRSDELERDLAVAGARLLLDVVDRLAAGPVPEAPQDDSQATYAPRLTKSDGLIDWTRPARAIHNQVRGLHPWPHAYTYHPRGRLILLRTAPGDARTAPGTPGTILEAEADKLIVATGDGVLAVRDLQAEGGRPLDARSFLAGHPLTRGQRLGLP